MSEIICYCTESLIRFPLSRLLWQEKKEKEKIRIQTQNPSRDTYVRALEKVHRIKDGKMQND